MEGNNDKSSDKNITQELNNYKAHAEKINSDQSTIFYDLYDQSKSFDFNILGKINGMSMRRALPKLVAEIDSTPLSKLIKKPPPIIFDFCQIVNSKIPQKFLFTLVSIWPPIFPRVTPEIELIVYLLLKMIHDSKYPEKMEAWILTGLFPRTWYVKDERPKLIAASLVRTPEKVDKWAVVDEDSNFQVFVTKSDGTLKEIFNEKATDVKVSNDGKHISVFGEGGSEIFEFVPKDKKCFKPWSNLFSEKRPCVWRFFTEQTKLLPDIVLTGVYKHVAQIHMHIIRALSQPKIFNRDNTFKVYSSIITVAAYTQKVPVYLHGILSTIFDNPHSTIEMLSKATVLPTLFAAMVSTYAKDYAQGFGRHLMVYLGSKGDAEIHDSEAMITTAFTAMKYILASDPLVTGALRMLTSMVHTYIGVRFNSQAAVRKILGCCFGRGIFGVLIKDSPLFGLPSMRSKVAHSVAAFITAVLCGEELPKDFNDPKIAERVAKHLEPRIAAFIDRISVATISEDFTFPVPDEDGIVEAITTIYNLVAENNNAIVSAFNSAQNEKVFATTPLGWAFAGALSGFFAQAALDTSGHVRIPASVPPLLSLATAMFPKELDAMKPFAELADSAEPPKQPSHAKESEKGNEEEKAKEEKPKKKKRKVLMVSSGMAEVSLAESPQTPEEEPKKEEAEPPKETSEPPKEEVELPKEEVEPPKEDAPKEQEQEADKKSSDSSDSEPAKESSEKENKEDNSGDEHNEQEKEKEDAQPGPEGPEPEANKDEQGEDDKPQSYNSPDI